MFLRVGPSPGGIFVRDVAGTLADVTWGRFNVLQGLTQIPEPVCNSAAASASARLVPGVAWSLRSTDGPPWHTVNAIASEGLDMTNLSPTWTVTIDAKPEAIWPYIADLGRHTEWSPKPYRVEWLSGEPNAVGSTFRSSGALPQDKDHAMEGSVLANTPPTTFAVKSSDKSGTFVNTLELRPEGNQTVVTRTVEFPPPRGAFVVLLPILMPTVIRPGIQKALDLLKTKVERGA